MNQGQHGYSAPEAKATHVLLIADTHDFLDPRIDRLTGHVDHVVHAGDIGPAVAEQLASAPVPATLVAGNCDAPETPWPESARLALPGGQLAITHGHRWPARTRHRRLRETYPHAAAIVYGHSHRRANDALRAPWIINPGAAGKTRAYDGPSAAELIAGSAGWRLISHVFEPLSKRG